MLIAVVRRRHCLIGVMLSNLSTYVISNSAQIKNSHEVSVYLWLSFT